MDLEALPIDEVDLGVGYVYRWVNLVNGKMYIGSHDGSKRHYRASGVAIRLAFDKYGIENFRREYLYIGEDFRSEEERLLKLVDAMRNPWYYNMHNSATGVGSGPDNHRYGKPGTRIGATHTEAAKKKISEIHKGKVESEETRRKKSIANSGERNPNFGKAMPEDQKAKISATRVERGSALGSNNPMYGKPRTDDVKEKLRKANLGKKASDETREKMSQMRKGRAQTIVSCPHCPKTGGISSMKRYHFDNCKYK